MLGSDLPLSLSAALSFTLVRRALLMETWVHLIVASLAWESPFDIKVPGMPPTSPPALQDGLWVN